MINAGQLYGLFLEISTLYNSIIRQHGPLVNVTVRRIVLVHDGNSWIGSIWKAFTCQPRPLITMLYILLYFFESVHLVPYYLKACSWLTGTLVSYFRDQRPNICREMYVWTDRIAKHRELWLNQLSNQSRFIGNTCLLLWLHFSIMNDITLLLGCCMPLLK